VNAGRFAERQRARRGSDRESRSCVLRAPQDDEVRFHAARTATEPAKVFELEPHAAREAEPRREVAQRRERRALQRDGAPP
jgi:hypothetical protein